MRVEFERESQRIPVKIWSDEIEEGALEQALNLSKLPFAFKHIAIMPDVHQGYGMPIGGVMATKDVIVPNAVGVDIGCGMCAVKLPVDADSFHVDTYKEIMSSIRKVVPVGFDHHSTKQGWDGFADVPKKVPIIVSQSESAHYQIGTLGGGNHFIELQKDRDSRLWIMIHSGSRNLGYKVANWYHEKAKKLCNRWCSSIPNEDLSFLPIYSDEGQDYKEAMDFCLRFAKANRLLMMNRVIDIIRSIPPSFEVSSDQFIDVHHNYARLENHFGENVWVHRKGATSARRGEIGIIPGSQGTSSYIVSGLGNPESFMSCSHGAGRKMSRNQAREQLDLEEEKERLDKLGVVHSIRTKEDLDEASSAYKDISSVMSNQSDLVDIITTLKPIAVIKG